MSTSTTEIFPETDWPKLRKLLQQYDNPFGNSIYPQSPTPHLRAFHVPEFNGKVAETLRQAVERLKSPLDSVATAGINEHPASGVLLVLGFRGDGKTHLLHETLLRPDFPAVTVAPSVLDSHRPFREFLLVQLIDHLQRQPPHRSHLIAMAQWFTRRVLADAVRAMSEVEWLALDVQRNGSWFYRLRTVLWSRDLEPDRLKIIQQLIESQLPTIREICDDQQRPWTQVRQAAICHVHRLCPTRTADQLLRRQIYLELIELAFDPNRESIYEQLAGGSSETVTDGLDLKPSREILVDTSLGLLLQLFQLYSRPICFVFDALETLFGTPVQPERCQKFHSDVAQSTDQLPGISFFIFSEAGFWQEIQKHFLDYAVNRFNRGMPTRGGGIERQLALEKLDSAKLRKIVSARMAPVVTEIRRELTDTEISDIIPFEESELAQISASGQAVRSAIQGLAAKYQERVFGDASLPLPVEREIWSKQILAARLECERPLLQLSEDLHGGLESWLGLLIEIQLLIDGWQLTETKMVTFGENVKYGQAIQCVWKRKEETRNVGLALLLAGGQGMMADLRDKLDMIAAKKRPVDWLFILWPKANELETSCEDQLPTGTKNVWNEEKYKSLTSGKKRRVWLRSVTRTKLAPWLAWHPAIQSVKEANASSQRLTDLVISLTASQSAESDLRGYVTPTEPSDDLTAE